jgi:hypothetical protein
MNPSDADRWKSRVLDEVFLALAASELIDEALIFKGARVLSIHLGGGRQSLDLDANLAIAWVEQNPDRGEQREFLEREVARAIRRRFESQNPVIFELTAVRVTSKPPNLHPLGWNSFKIRLNVDDLTAFVRGLPAIEIDVAAPEELIPTSVAQLAVGGHTVNAYTLERIAGEKLRAFLSSLPAYRAKVKKPGTAVRAKDLYDLARVRRVRDLGNAEFWQSVGLEFVVACRSRFVDCSGLDSFQEQWEVTKKTYSAVVTSGDATFEEAEVALREIVEFFKLKSIIPIAFPLP